jgi:hypothetical protein
VNELSGWPSTTASGPEQYECIADAAAQGQPARMIVISPGQGDSGRKTGDGYDIPTHRVVTWVVRGPREVEQVTDMSEDGGPVTTERCTGLSAAQLGSPPAGIDCRPT